jgi:hypothetical protein
MILNDRYEKTTTIQCDRFGCGKTEEFDDGGSIADIKNKLIDLGWTIIITKKKTKYYCPNCISLVENIGG